MASKAHSPLRAPTLSHAVRNKRSVVWVFRRLMGDTDMYHDHETDTPSLISEDGLDLLDAEEVDYETLAEPVGLVLCPW